MAYFKYYTRMKSLSVDLEPPMNRTRSNWTNKCIPCNNWPLPHFIQVGQHFGERRPK